MIEILEILRLNDTYPLSKAIVYIIFFYLFIFHETMIKLKMGTKIPIKKSLTGVILYLYLPNLKMISLD